MIITSSHRHLTWGVLALIAAIVSTVFIEHSALDLQLSQSVYQGNGQWWIDKDNRLWDALFYTGPKRLLIVLELYVLVVWIARLYSGLNSLAHLRIFAPLAKFKTKELSYFIGASLGVPLVVATLKAVTHVPCPAYLQHFGGTLAYMTIWQNMHLHLPARCFPAAHASAGFALYALAFVPTFRQQSVYRHWMIIAAISVLGWMMGGYKILIGDHFFSHTLVSMLLAYSICSFTAYAFRLPW